MRRAACLWLALMATQVVPAPRAARALDLPSALREMAGANPTLAGRRAMADAARRRVPVAGAWESPMFEIGAINVPASGRFDMDPMTMKMVGLRQRVPVSGANGLERRSASAAADAEGAGLEATGYELDASLWEAYADAYYADRLARSAEAHRGEMEQLVASARARYESGAGRLDDLLRAQAEQARTLADFATYGAEERGARARLAALLGREGAMMADTLAPPPATTLPDDPGTLVGLVNAGHPRLRELRSQADRYRLSARAMRRMLWPDLQLGVSYGLRQPIMGAVQDNMWTATLGVMVPVFAGQRELPGAAGMDAMARASAANERAAALDLDQQVRTLHATAMADRRTIALLADTVLVAQRRAVAASWSAYNAGTSDLWRVFESMHDLYGGEIALTRARQDLERTEARLLAVTARGDLFGLALPAFDRSER